MRFEAWSASNSLISEIVCRRGFCSFCFVFSCFSLTSFWVGGGMDVSFWINLNKPPWSRVDRSPLQFFAPSS